MYEFKNIWSYRGGIIYERNNPLYEDLVFGFSYISKDGKEYAMIGNSLNEIIDKFDKCHIHHNFNETDELKFIGSNLSYWDKQVTECIKYTLGVP